MLTVMKILKNLLFALILMVGTSVAVSAQRNDDKKPPPKDGKPPIIQPGDKDRPKDTKDKPKDDGKKNKPKKPEYEAIAAVRLIEIALEK